jgi:plastocyanin
MMRSIPVLTAILALGLVACGGDDDDTTVPDAAGAATVDVISASDCSELTTKVTIGNTGTTTFAPDAATIKVGEVIKFLPSGPHDMQSDDGTTFDSGGFGTSACLRFNVAGSYPFHCGNHPGMKGTITVTQ